MEIQAVVFDLYGTLVCKPAGKSYEFLSRHLDRDKIGDLKDFVLTRDIRNVEFCLEAVLSKESLKDFRSAIEEDIKTVTCYRETWPVVRRLKEKGLKLGLISNLALPYKLPFFSLGLSKYFDETLFSCEAGVKKPEPEIYHRMIRKLNQKPCNILFGGDDLLCDIKGPANLGMNTVRIEEDDSKSNPSLYKIFDFLD